MGNVFNKTGSLEVSIGEGYLSAYEVSVLKPGDTVVTEKLAAEGFSVCFNGHFVCTAEMVILDTTFGIRVTSLLPPEDGAGVPRNADDAIEMLPFFVRIGRIKISLADLAGVGPGSIINLDTPYSVDEDAELVVAGIPIAAGKVGATYENMSLRITRIEDGPHEFGGLEVRSSGSLLERDFVTRFTKDYNFKRPDKFSRNAIDRMAQIHDLFIRNLRLKHDLFDEYTLTPDQMNFGELLGEIAGRSFHYLLLQNLPWSREQEGVDTPAEGSRSVPKVDYFEPADARYPASDESRALIHKYIMGEGRGMADGVFVIVTTEDPVSTLAEDEEKRRFLLASLRGAWKNIVGMNFQLSKQTDDVEQIRVINDNEMVLTLTASTKSGDALIAIVYPYPTLHPLVRILNS